MHDWDRILDEFGPVVWKQAVRMLGDRADAADCFQAVMLEAFELSEREVVRSWPALLRRLAILRSLDRLRDRYRRQTDSRPADELGLVSTRDGPADAAAENRELAERLRLALAELPPTQAEAFALRFIDGLTNEEVAARMGLTANHVGVLLHRARATLRGLLEPEREARR